MKKVCFGLFLVITTLVLGACTEIIKGRDMETVTGTVFYLQRIALPNTAKLTVTLSDVSIADKPAEVISQHAYITEGRQVPLPFTLNYSPTQIKKGHIYNVSAKIEINDRLIFINESVNHVITDSNNTKNIKILVKSAKG